jgi:GNAT superfamily N-acetyltransferase
MAIDRMRNSKLSDVELTGYFPGVIGKITDLHATYYYENWNLDASFETQVGRELSEFISEFEENRDGFWVATVAGEFAGSVAVDGRHTSQQGARLRWLIVAPSLQGRGIGGVLIKEAIEFCKRVGYKKVYLWTFKGLEAARLLYERAGFRHCEEHNVDQWGRRLTEQMFEMYLDI